MVGVSVKYTGNLHCDATHGPSQSKISTDAPTDNKGKGEAFSPTDLVATALATCMSTTMGIKAQELGVDLRGMSVSVQKEMSKDAPRRIVALPSEVHISLPPDSPHRDVLEQTALNCDACHLERSREISNLIARDSSTPLGMTDDYALSGYSHCM
ncbi:MAG: osmotically inducible protein OsmC [Verrucomicrobia bacterium]|nr:MAG: osmotically inducible protein OsmC [Verrucomicrobiota bacterium]